MLSRNEYRAKDAVGLAELVRSGEVSAREVLETAIAEIERLDPALNAVVMRNYEKARDDADAVDRTAPLAGVPLPAKDVNVHVAGFPTTWACRFFAGAAAETRDSLLVSRWRAAGMVVPVRTNTPEFATEFVCEPELYGPTANPWDLTRTPGGSSGGAAAAVASGMMPMAHATDSGGSIRVPAGCCGVFGFKPSSGLVAVGSEYGPLVGGLNCDHAITWTVRDSAALLDATVGPEIGAPVPHAAPPGSFLAALDQPPGALRIGVVCESPSGHMPTPEIADRVDATVRTLEALGHRVRPWTWPITDDFHESAFVLWACELTAAIADRAEVLGRPPRAAELGPLVATTFHAAARMEVDRWMGARKTIRALQVRMAESMADIDVLLTPVTAEPPLETGLLGACMASGLEAWNARSARFAPYTETFNVTGQPAMSVPLHHGADGLPIGMHFVGQVGEDTRLLRLARQLEEAAPWAGRRPPCPHKTPRQVLDAL